MIRTSIRADTSARAAIERRLDTQLRQRALGAVDAAAREALQEMRGQMAAAGLGTLGRALGSGSDKSKGGQVHMKSGGGWSASGWVYIRSKSPRSVGAIISYTEPSTLITPKKGRWLWIPTDEAYRTVGLPPGSETKKARLEPHLWDQTWGNRFGPLAVIKSVNGWPLMILKNPASVRLSGQRGIKPLLKSGRAPKGFVPKEFIVMFIGIPRTSRKARIDPRAIAARAAVKIPALLGPAFTAEAS